MSNHSSAPFTADDNNGCKTIYDAGGFEIANTHGVGEPEDQANAVLFAAAPEMLDMLKQIEAGKPILPLSLRELISKANGD